VKKSVKTLTMYNYFIQHVAHSKIHL